MSSDSEEVLVELSNNEIEAFRVFYKNLKDREFLFVHLYLRNQLRWNKIMGNEDISDISDRCKMTIYGLKNGNIEHKTLIGITADKEYTVFIASLDESLEELRFCLEKTKIIKWECLPMFVAVHRRFHKMLYEIFENKNVRVRIDNYCSTLWMDKENAKNFDYSLPEDIDLKLLDLNDAVKMNEVWPYRYQGSEKFIKSLIKLNGGFGIQIGNELVSWILQVECFGLGLLQTVDEHQGKGFARILTRALTKKIALDDNEDVILFASYSKPKTVDLYIRYGFKHISYTHWLYLKKISEG